MIIFLLSLLIVILGVLLFFSVRKNLELLEALEFNADQIKEALEEIEIFYSKIERKSKMEIFLDEPVIRELSEDIKGTKKAIRNIAEKISVLVEEE